MGELLFVKVEMIEDRPANVPQRYANQATHARYAAHARTFFLSDFISIENKGSKIQIPKLVIRVRFPSPAPLFPQYFAQSIFSTVKGSLEPSPDERHWDSHFCAS